MFVVVEFKQLNKMELAVVPLQWLSRSKTKCHWPSSLRRGQSLEEMVKSMTLYDKKWPQFRIKKIHHECAIYEEAEQKMNLLLDQPNYDTASTTSSYQKMSLAQLSPTSSLADESLESINGIENAIKSLETQHPVECPNYETTTLINLTVKDILRAVVQLKEQVTQNSIILNEILQMGRAQNINNLTQKPIDLSDLPFHDLTAFNEFDLKIKTNESIRIYLVHRLAAVGGSGIEAHVRRILKHVLSNNVAKNFNWKGRDKLPFEKTNFIGVIYDAINKCYTEERSDKRTADACKEWLKFAKTRYEKENK